MHELAQECPVPAAHRRLEDAHRLWHQAADQYDNLDGFRTNLNACIQALRNVTFVVQKQKLRIPDFDSWYSEWQNRLKADPILKWLLQARNRIIHEGDLEVRSTVRVSVLADYFEPPYYEITVHPVTSTPEIAAQLAKQELPNALRRIGLLKVERRWIAEDLPEIELLEALAHAYGVLSTLVNETHKQVGLAGTQVHVRGFDSPPIPLQASTAHLKGRLPCMVASAETRTVWVKLATGEFLRPSISVIPEMSIDEVKARYASLFRSCSGHRSPRSLREFAELFFEWAKHFLLIDGCHIPTVFFLLPNEEISLMTFIPEDSSEKYLIWRQVARQIERNGAKAVITITESWGAPFDPKFPRRPASESPHRIEVLDLTAASSEGEEFSIICTFKRVDGSIEFGETEIASETTPFFLEPVRKVWDISKKKKIRSRPLRKYEIGRNSPCPCRSRKKFKNCCASTLGTGLKNKAWSLYNNGKYDEAERAFRSWLTQYIVWYNEHTVPFVEDNPTKADELLVVDIEAVISLVQSIARCLYHQGKQREIDALLRESFNIIDDQRYKTSIESLHASWLSSIGLDPPTN